MNREELIKRVSNYFAIQELVGRRTYKKHGHRSWKFLDSDTLHCLLIIREGIGKPMTVNDWHRGGKYQQRGLRTIVQQLVKDMFRRGLLYLSAHLFGKAFDFKVQGMSANDVRSWIVRNSHLFPCKIRLERKLRGKYITWVHLDTFYESKNPKVYLFDV